MNVMVTGGSGFIGTNLVEHYARRGCEVVNLDTAPPRNPAHGRFWQKLDILDSVQLREAMHIFSPTLVMHMAARTDLEGKSVRDYTVNFDGVRAVIEAASGLPSPPRIICSSSMLVCKLGYQPKNCLDYCPTTPYGESKVMGEQVIRELATGISWTIVRPTSLWGPWFDVPYKNFFDAIKERLYFHPRGRKIRRSYGFVLNSVYQLDRIASCKHLNLIDGKTLYLADYEPIELLNWANIISANFGLSSPREIPVGLLRGLAFIGDILKMSGLRHPPLTSTRLTNLLTNAVFDLSELESIVGTIPYSIEQGVGITVNWMRRFAGSDRWPTT